MTDGAVERVSPERVRYDACPLCGSSQFRHEVTGGCANHHSYDPRLSPQIRWMRCADCTHSFAEGYYTDAALEVLFSKTQDNQTVGAGLEQNREVSARMIEKVLPYRQDGVWLDVGCGNGSLLFTAAEFGFDPVGLDLRPQTVAGMNALGVECHQQDITAFQYNRPISVVSMADVLEHTHYPKACLEATHSLMEPGGVLFVSMPNADSMLWNIATQQNSNPYWGELEHYHNFGRTRLYDVLQETGFTPVRYGISERYRMCMEVIALSDAAA